MSAKKNEVEVSMMAANRNSSCSSARASRPLPTGESPEKDPRPDTSLAAGKLHFKSFGTSSDTTKRHRLKKGSILHDVDGDGSHVLFSFVDTFCWFRCG